MPEEYTALVQALKGMEQAEDPTQQTPVMVSLPMAEDEWYTRPDTVSYGIVALDFEDDQLHGDGIKLDRSWEGSVDLFSMVRGGAGWVPLIENVLTNHCGGSWSLNTHAYERDTGLFHWEWVFRI